MADLMPSDMDRAVRALMLHKFGDDAAVMFDIPANAPAHAREAVAKRLEQARGEVAAVAAALSQPQAVPEGWALVPEDATDEMVAAALKCDWTHEDEAGTVHDIHHSLVSAAPPAPSAWRPIAEAPTDETTIERWHALWKCPVAVQRNNGRIPGYPEWITATKDQTWPEEAFTPHFRALSAPPAQAQEGHQHER